MDLMLDIPVVAWQIAYMLIALFIPVWIIMKIFKAMVGSGKKTYRTIRH